MTSLREQGNRERKRSAIENRNKTGQSDVVIKYRENENPQQDKQFLEERQRGKENPDKETRIRPGAPELKNPPPGFNHDRGQEPERGHEPNID